VRDSDRVLACRNCGREYPSSRLDRQRWCDRCRREVVRRATRVGRLAGLLGALALIGWLAVSLGSAPRFLVGWAVLVAAVYFFLYKLTQRVAFEVIRSRGVPPPEE
jgi:apolipoprotein N-acyltransferase